MMANRSSPDHLRIVAAPVPLAPLIGRERGLALALALLRRQPDGDGRSQVTLTIKDDDGKDLVYPFEGDGTAARATP